MKTDGRAGKTIFEIAYDWAIENGYDAFLGNYECACRIDDSCKCGYEGCHECVPGYVCPCKDCDEDLKSKCDIISSEETEECYYEEKCAMRLRLEARDV